MQKMAFLTFGEIIIHWYHQHKRDLPWRKTKDPFKIWLSEIILQQTRVDQGLSYYNRFIDKYPEVKKLAAAKEDEVLKMWQGLGYYSRARNLHHAAKEIVSRFNGKFPKRYEDIRSLKGIGDYTAAAVASFAFSQPYPVVDGNVFRLLSRYLGIKTPINSAKAKKEFYEAALALMKKKSPHDFNQAIMEFGALQCKPANPQCGECPLNKSCYAFSVSRVKEFPVKIKSEKMRNRYFYYASINNGNKILLKKRTGNDIWKNLYDFPMIESSKRLSTKKLLVSSDWKKLFEKKNILILKESQVFTHQLSHQQIFAKFFEIKISTSLKIKDAKSINRKDIHQYAVPKLIENYLSWYENSTPEKSRGNMPEY